MPENFNLGDLQSLWMSKGVIKEAAPIKIVYEKVEKGKYYNADVNLKLT